MFVLFLIEQIFKGNTDPYKAVEVELVKPVYTRYVRLYPQSWEDGVALKLELFGCRPEKITRLHGNNIRIVLMGFPFAHLSWLVTAFQ